MVAMLGGGRRNAATDFLLLLDRPKRALQCLLGDEPIPRGDVGCEFYGRDFGGCGMDLGEYDTQLRADSPDRSQVIVVWKVEKEGPAWRKLKEGDVILNIDGVPLTGLLRIDEALDTAVGCQVKFELLRVIGGCVTRKEVDIAVRDLHSVAASDLLQANGATFHPISFIQSIRSGLSCNGIYFHGFPPHKTSGLLESINGQPVCALSELENIIRGIPDRARVSYAYRTEDDPRTRKDRIVWWDWTWSSPNATVGFWLDRARPTDREHDAYVVEGIPSTTITPVLQDLQETCKPNVNVPPAELQPVLLKDARVSLPEDMVQKFVSQDRVSQDRVARVFRVARVIGEEQGLHAGDLITHLDEELLDDLSILDVRKHEVEVAIVREGKSLKRFSIKTLPAAELNPTETINFAGLVVQKPPIAVRQQVHELPSEVWITNCAPGSPAQLDQNVGALEFITQVNGEVVTTLDDFVKQVEPIGDKTGVVIETQDFCGKIFTAKLKTELTHFPTRRVDIRGIHEL